MRGFFSLDGPFSRFMGRFADLLMLNLLFIICSIPIVTIGASTTAMYYVTLKMAKDEESYITKSFFKSFKMNFFQSTIIWLIALFLGAIIAVDYMITAGKFGFTIDSEIIAKVIRILLMVVFIVYMFTLTYVFPLLSKFDNTVKNTIRNALLMSIRHLPVTIACIVIMGIIILALFLYPPIISIFLFVGCSGTCYGYSHLFSKVFDKYITEEDEVSGEVIEETNI